MKLFDKIRKAIDLFLIRHSHNVTDNNWIDIDRECEEKGLPKIPDNIRKKLSNDAFLCNYYSARLEKLIQFIHNNYSPACGTKVMQMFVLNYLNRAIADEGARLEFLESLSQVLEHKTGNKSKPDEEKQRYIG